MNAKHLQRGRAGFLVVVTTLPLLLGSVCRTNLDPVCTAIAVASVVLNIRDAQNKPISNASVVYKKNYDAPVTVTCDGNCDSLVLAWEEPGHFEYRVTSGGYVGVSGEVDVYMDADGCHVIGQARTIVLQRDDTAGVLFGAWTYTNIAGQSTILRFDEDGTPIGAILTKRVNTGDTNIYIQFNDRTIAGAPGQTIQPSPAQFPTRQGMLANWTLVFGGIPVGFENATLAANFNSLTGVLLGSSVTYTRLKEVPAALRDPA